MPLNVANKKNLFLILIILLIGLSFFIFKKRSKESVRSNTLSMKEIKSHFGEEAFSAQKFKNESKKSRSSMAASLIESHMFVGKKRAYVIEMLGPSDGRYFLEDYIPTYVLEDSKQNGAPIWQMVFLLDAQEKVEKIIVQQAGSEIDEWTESTQDIDDKLDRAHQTLQKSRAKK